MTQKDEALKMAILQMKAYGFKHLCDYQCDDKELLEVIKACEEALAELEQVEPFGYFKAEPFGWTDCADTDEGAIALYENPPPKQDSGEAVAWVGYKPQSNGTYFHVLFLEKPNPINLINIEPLYTSPPKRELAEKEIAHYKAQINAFREFLRWECDTMLNGQNPEWSKKYQALLSQTAPQCLQEHDNEVIERCAKICENAINRESANWIVAHSFAEAIRELKGKQNAI